MKILKGVELMNRQVKYMRLEEFVAEFIVQMKEVADDPAMKNDLI